MVSAMLKAQNIQKSYAQGRSSLSILKGLDFEIRQGEAVCILGASGSGKSTLLQILGTLDRPDSGSLHWLDQDLLAMPDEELAKFRNKEMGFVFQFHHLMSELTAYENVLLPSRIGNQNLFEAKRLAQEILSDLGLSDRLHHYPSELSGGELQRVAIARALIRRPRILFADEPTGNLDSKTSLIIQDLFFSLREKYGLSLVVVTHDLNFAKRFPRILRLKDGLWSAET